MRVIFLDIDGVLTTCSYHNPDTNHIDPRRVWILRFQAGILGYSIAGMKAFEGKFSYENQLFS